MKDRIYRTLCYALVAVIVVGCWFLFADKPTEAEKRRALEENPKYQQGYEAGYRAGLEEGREEGFDDGHFEGYEEGFDQGHSDGYWDGYHEGSQYGWEDNIHEVADYFAGGAVDFAIEHGGMHPEDAASIIENGGTKSEYEAAAKTLYYYFMYFFNCEYS